MLHISSLRTSCPSFSAFFSAVLLAVPQIAATQHAPDPRVADLVHAGEVRIALFVGQYTKDPATGELRGVWADVARAFAARVGVRLVLLEYPPPPKTGRRQLQPLVRPQRLIGTVIRVIADAYFRVRALPEPLLGPPPNQNA